MSKWSYELFKENVAVLVHNYKKKEPLIMTVGGIAGFVATAVLAYRAKAKITTIVEDIEAMRENDMPVPVGETIVRVSKALTGRNALLASALASATQANHKLRRQIREQYPDDPNAQFIGEREEVLAGPEEEGKKKPKTVTVINTNDIQWMEYAYFNKSQEFVKDDLNYNQMFITTMFNALDEKRRRQGFLNLTTAYDVLKIPLEKHERRAGSELGWTDNDFFDFDVHVVMVKDENGYPYPVPVIEFSPVKDITTGVDYGSDISDYLI